jgi:hypothetical protein
MKHRQTEDAAMADQFNPGDKCEILRDISVGEQLAFQKGEEVTVEKVVPNPQKPRYKYVVHSSRLQKYFQLSDDALIDVPHIPPRLLRMATADFFHSKKNIAVLVVGCVVAVLIIASVAIVLTRNHSDSRRTLAEIYLGVPIYPNSKLQEDGILNIIDENATSSLMNHDVTVALYTLDSTEKVVSWYETKLTVKREAPPDPMEEKLSEGRVFYDITSERRAEVEDYNQRHPEDPIETNKNLHTYQTADGSHNLLLFEKSGGTGIVIVLKRTCEPPSELDYYLK